MLAGNEPGFVYQRDGHPNAVAIAEKCRLLHGAEKAAVTSSGMSALSLALLSQAKSGDHLIISDRLYGRSLALLVKEAGRLGIEATVVDTCDLAATQGALRATTRMIVVETITNPTLRVPDLAALAEIAAGKAELLVDNTFASPIVCRPLEFGAAFAMESLTKIMNGHSDVMLGLLAGPARLWGRVADALSSWGLASSPFDCWLAERGLATLHLRAERACSNALAAAEFLAESAELERVDYPGLASHPDHAIAVRQFGKQFGWMVTIHLCGGRSAAEAFLRGAARIPFCPSLGEVSTTLSHPESTSHRSFTSELRAKLGITGGTIRLSIGTESPEFVREALAEGLAEVRRG